ncbi:MAG TPA: cupredoxin family copper-binding protein [Gemmatimonadales bacterium]|jgi:plastocyanin
MRRSLLAVAGAAALLGGGVAACFSDRTAPAADQGECRFPGGEDVPGSTVVLIRGFEFLPAEVRVRAGERVTWINCAEDAHTSTADGGQWASQLMVPGDAFTQAFDAPGDFTYHCEPHPFMTGRVMVE